ncbi:MAG: sodium:calcium symporter [Deltaproteobacteria bacterium RIFCSPHIGHO2_02_FULL_50_15]|nr:MAG: sodium:calcium symporter [Deltaproteobacteria bacterium RIFCSPHIGHO2_02_FULL_50_15]
MKEREIWATRIGLILAMAGNAIGLGNFLRFPVQCAGNGGGAFLVPYFIALILLGIPLMWVEWAMGRFGGGHGHGTTPGMFHKLWHHPMAKYLGTIGIFISFGVAVYYVYIESWTLGYTFFSATGKYFGLQTREAMGAFLGSYQGKIHTEHFSGLWAAYLFYLVALALNIYILSKGIVKGIELLAKIAMPLLFIMAILLVIRVFSLGTPDPAQPENSIINGLGFMWNPDLASLKNAKVWLAAAGQIFFTLSVGFGAIQTYASYLRKNDDVALNGLTTAVTNEFAEVILGGSIAIPVAVAFFGVAGTAAIAQGGAFDLGFQSMPLIFQKIPLGQLFGTLWFALLFIAGMTSSVAIIQPFMAFLQDEFHWTRKKATWMAGTILFILGQPVIFLLKTGYLDEWDFWMGTFGVVAFAFIEVVIFMWIFKSDRAWNEITQGADIRIPRIFYYILKYVTPLFLLLLLIAWLYQSGIDILLLRGVPDEKVTTIVFARIIMSLYFMALCLGVHWVAKNRAHWRTHR